jgi:hypothetical protein
MKRTIREKRRKRGMSGRRDGDRGAVSNGDMTVNGMWRERERERERGKDTGIVDEVSGGTAVEDVLRRRKLIRLKRIYNF